MAMRQQKDRIKKQHNSIKMYFEPKAMALLAQVKDDVLWEMFEMAQHPKDKDGLILFDTIIHELWKRTPNDRPTFLGHEFKFCASSIFPNEQKYDYAGNDKALLLIHRPKDNN